MIPGDTITAISSAAAPAMRIIVRLSGPQSHPIARQLSALGDFAPASARRAMISFDNLQCPAWIYAFTAPNSYTGEDTIEFHIPGNPLLAGMLLKELYRLGARPAEAGEFTARAFFNGKIGLTKAEGVAATIAAGNQAELTAARQLLAGELARRLQPMTESLAQTLALIEVGIDFSEEDVTFLAAEEVTQRIDDAESALNDLLDQSSRFERLAHEPRIVFAGRPNAGKSSLINALTRRNRAVVSNLAGTTRDVLSAPLDLPCGRVFLCDIAGLDAATAGDDPQSEIERSMQTQARVAIEAADHVILVQDCTDDRPSLALPRTVALIVETKSDLRHGADSASGACCAVSSLTGEGLDLLREKLDLIAFGSGQTSAALALNQRHVLAVHTAITALHHAGQRVIENAPELVAMDLRDVLDALGGITGAITSDDVLGKIFSTFCIGK